MMQQRKRENRHQRVWGEGGESCEELNVNVGEHREAREKGVRQWERVRGYESVECFPDGRWLRLACCRNLTATSPLSVDFSTSLIFPNLHTLPIYEPPPNISSTNP
ncbi:hypothetical protein AB6A40_004447 [Gnathostoma spinigerum]|uniref:Uncharacterized protein n=1 Tax=Gnathostoma spinigerum TaxID=75299 RepID=A0ABD6ECI9_9BILA